MSASQEKKLRQQLRAEGKDKRQLEQAKAEIAEKKKHRVRLSVGIAVAIILVAIFVWNTNVFYSSFTAVKIGDTSYSAAEYNFFYNITRSNYVNQYGQYFGIDATTNLKTTNFSEDQTWYEFIRESVDTQMKEMTALYDEAMKEDFVLSDDDKTALEDNIDSFKTGYEDAGYTNLQSYLNASFGKGSSMSTISSLLEKYYISQAYAESKQESFTYTSEDLQAYYSENKDELDNYTYISAFVDGSVPEEDSTVTDDNSTDSQDAESTEASETSIDESAETETSDENTDAAAEEAMANAKTIADEIVAQGATADEFKAAVLAETQSEVAESTSQGSSLSSTYADWLKDSSRREGDTTVVETDTGYYAVYFINRDDNSYKTINVRHILIKAVADEDGSYSDEAKDTAKKAVEDLLAEWNSGDATEDSFAELANANSEDAGSNTNGGLYEDVYKGQMVTEFNDWCFDPDRKTGDTGIVYGESSSYAGYHAVYFVGEGKPYSEVLAEDGKREKDYTDWHDALLENYEVSNGFTYGLVG